MNTNVVDVPSNEVWTDDPLPADGAPHIRLRAPLVPLHTPERILRAPLAVVLLVDLMKGHDLMWFVNYIQCQLYSSGI